MEHRILAHSDAQHLEDRIGGLSHVIAHEFAEWPFGQADVGQEAALDHHLGLGRHLEADMVALAHGDGLAAQPGRYLELVHVIGQGRGRGQEGMGRWSDKHRGFQRPAHLFGFLVIDRQMVARRKAAAQLAVVDIHRAVIGQVAHPRLGILRDEHGRGEIGPAIAVGIGDEGQVGEPDLFIFRQIGRGGGNKRLLHVCRAQR